jgi:uroporphyrinogen-III decarboxylase
MNELMTAIGRAIDALAADRDRYDAAAKCQCDTVTGSTGRQPLLVTSPHPLQREMPGFNMLQTHYDSEKMLACELRAALSAAAGGREAVPSVRSNMGCGIVPALFGVMQELFEDKPPWVQKHMKKEEIAAMTVSDIKVTPEFRAALDHMEFFGDKLRESGVRVYPVDIQGAFDTAHLVLGDDIFYEMYDDPPFVHHLLDLSATAVCLAWDECVKRIDRAADEITHYNALALPRSAGAIKLSEDTSTLLSKDQIDEFVVPYIRRIFDHTGGGYIHYCGKNPHLYKAVTNEPRVTAINFGNPEKHDMEQVLRDCASRGIFYYGSVPKKAGETPEDYFSRIVPAAHRDGRIYLLLQYSCAEADRQPVSDAWDRVTFKYINQN